MKRFLLLIVVCGAVAAALVHGCGARVEVAKDRVREKIDALLGKMDVQRKEIELGIANLKQGIDGLRRAKVKAQVSGDQIGRKAKPEEEKLVNMDAALKTLRVHLEVNQPVEIAGKSYSPTELKEMAERVMAARKTCAGQLEALHGSQDRLQKVVQTLDRKQQEAQSRLTDIEGQVVVIDSNRIALTAMQKSAEAMGENDGSLIKSLDHLQDKVSNLYTDVETELRCEDAKWSDDANKEINSVDAVVMGLQTSHDTVSEIDQILGNSKK
jgi:transcriptional regulator with PAS, ATPase and Fis domain